MEADQYEKGLNNILNAIHGSVEERRIEGAVVTHDADVAQRRDVRITVRVGEKSEIETFAAEELVDCGQAIDAPAARKVRMLLSHFIK